SDVRVPVVASVSVPVWRWQLVQGGLAKPDTLRGRPGGHGTRAGAAGLRYRSLDRELGRVGTQRLIALRPRLQSVRELRAVAPCAEGKPGPAVSQMEAVRVELDRAPGARLGRHGGRRTAKLAAGDVRPDVAGLTLQKDDRAGGLEIRREDRAAEPVRDGHRDHRTNMVRRLIDGYRDLARLNRHG